jgi:hypothetical protein
MITRPPESRTTEYGERTPERILASPADGAQIQIGDALEVLATMGRAGWVPAIRVITYKVQDVDARGGLIPLTHVTAVKLTQ